MTDLQEFETFFNKFDIKFETYQLKNKYKNTEKSDNFQPNNWVIETDNGIGYTGFIASFEFDETGKFLEYGIFE